MSYLEEIGMKSIIDQLLGEIRLGYSRLEEKMADITTALQELRDAVTAVAERVANQTEPLTRALEEARTALVAEREAAAALAVTEDAEDVQQNADLTSARAATDEALANVQTAADSIEGEVGRLNQIAQPPEPV